MIGEGAVFEALVPQMTHSGTAMRPMASVALILGRPRYVSPGPEQGRGRGVCGQSQ